MNRGIARKLTALWISLAMVAGWSFAEEGGGDESAGSEDPVAAAVNDVSMIPDLLAGKTAEEAQALAQQLVEAAIAAGGSEREVKNRIAYVVAAAISQAGGNAEAVARGLVQGAGADHVGLVVGTIVVAGEAAGLDEGALAEAAVDAAPEGSKEVAEDAANNPSRHVGRIRAWVVAHRARRGVETAGMRTTTTTTTTTTTVVSPTPVSGEGL